MKSNPTTVRYMLMESTTELAELFMLEKIFWTTLKAGLPVDEVLGSPLHC